MNFIFSKKALWAVVFAAAAIFAVTFVACDNGNDPAPASYPLEAGQAVAFFAAGVDMETGTPAGYSLVQKDEQTGVVYFATPRGYYNYKPVSTVKVGDDGKLKTGSPGEVYFYGKVTESYTAYAPFTGGMVDADGVLKGSLTKDDRYICSVVPTSEAPAAITEGEIAVTGATADKVYHVEIVYTSNTAATGYYAGSTGKVTVANLKVGDRYVISSEIENVLKVTLDSDDIKFTATEATAAGITGGAAAAANEVYKVTKLIGTGTYAGGPYFKGAENKIIAGSGVTATNDLVLVEKVTGFTKVALSGSDITFDSTTAGAMGAATTAKIYSVDVLIKGNASLTTGVHYCAGASNAIVLANSTANDIVIIEEITSSVITESSSKIATGFSAGDLVFVKEIITTGSSQNGLKVVSADGSVPGSAGLLKYLVTRVAEAGEFKTF